MSVDRDLRMKRFWSSGDLKKVSRFIWIYGLRRTLVKALGRKRNIGTPLFIPKVTPQVGVIGCGQFAFATVGYFLVFVRKVGIAACYDINLSNAESFAKFYRVPHNAQAADGVLEDPAVSVVFIASNHASHTEYACRALRRGIATYVEKPVAVTLPQLFDLHRAVRSSGAKIYAGYNRPFAGAVRSLKAAVEQYDVPMTLSCFVIGHVLSADHWYRNAGEGTRICGNVGHWLDLAVHMLCWGNMPDRWRIRLCWSDDTARDDNLSIALASDRGDLVNIVLTARSEPFEGINETIQVQWGEVIAKIDDFRRIDLWKRDAYSRRRFWPKDVGHRGAIDQPFVDDAREWKEVEMSTLLMLRIAAMTVQGVSESEFSFAREYAALAEQDDGTEA